MRQKVQPSSAYDRVSRDAKPKSEARAYRGNHSQLAKLNAKREELPDYQRDWVAEPSSKAFEDDPADGDPDEDDPDEDGPDSDDVDEDELDGEPDSRAEAKPQLWLNYLIVAIIAAIAALLMSSRMRGG